MFITHGDTRIFATAFGPKSAPTILAMGGWIGSWEDWIETLSPLSENWRVIAYDHRGSGITITPGSTITFDTLIDDVFRVMEAYKIERCVLAAMSMGAAVAIGAALRHPEAITALVLANSIDLRDSAEDKPDDFLAALRHAYPRALEGFIQACVVEPDSEHIRQWGRHILNRASQEAAIRLYELSKTIHLQEDLPRVTQPTLLIHGDKDQIAPLESAEWLVHALPKAVLNVIHNAGHVPILTRPDEVAQAIEFFCRSNQREP